MVYITTKSSEIHKAAFREDAYQTPNGKVFELFLQQASDANPNLTFIRTGQVTAWILHKPDDLYGVARITYDDTRTRYEGPPKPTYNLYSRTLENHKRKSGNDEHYMKSSSDMGKLVANIGAHVKPLSANELVRLTSVAAAESITDFFSPLVRKRDSLRRTIGVVADSPAERFLMGIGRHNAQTLPQELQLVSEFLELQNNLQDMDIRKRTVRAVILSDDMVRVVVVPTHYRYDGVPTLTQHTDEYELYWHDKVPQVITERVNALRISEPLEFIPGVGVRHSDKVFYVVI